MNANTIKGLIKVVEQEFGEKHVRFNTGGKSDIPYKLS